MKRQTPKQLTVPTDLDFEKALMFFHAYMYGPLQGKLRLYQARTVRPSGKVQSSDWEVFASILVRDVGSKLGKGIDLTNYEVKSAENQSSYEYQYHKVGGKAKLTSDMKAGHLFFDHSNNLRLVQLRYAHGADMKAQFFGKWLKSFPDPYQQRYRRQVAYGWVEKHGQLLMTLEEGEVIFPETASVSPRTVSKGLVPSEKGEDVENET